MHSDELFGPGKFSRFELWPVTLTVSSTRISYLLQSRHSIFSVVLSSHRARSSHHHTEPSGTNYTTMHDTLRASTRKKHSNNHEESLQKVSTRDDGPDINSSLSGSSTLVLAPACALASTILKNNLWGSVWMFDCW